MSDMGPNVRALADLATPWCLHVAVTLGVADHLAAGVSRIEDLAAATASDSQTLWDLLGHLVSKGVFEEPEPGRFVLNHAGEQLRDPSLRLFLDLNAIGGRFAQAWSTMPTYVRTGRAAYHEIFGVGFWEDLDQHPDIAASFDELMTAGHSGPEQIPTITDSWADVQTVVDVGGGLGHVLAEILQANPHIRGTLVELPGTAERAANSFERLGIGDRVELVRQSFFEPLPAGADIYLLRGILNDWPDADKEKILRRCADASAASSRTVIWGGGVRKEGGRRSIQIDKVLLGGRDTPLDEFRALVARSGLEVMAIHEPRFILECRPIAAESES